MNKLIGFVGNEVVVGDEVVAMVRRGERSKELVRGLVVDITPRELKSILDIYFYRRYGIGGC